MSNINNAKLAIINIFLFLIAPILSFITSLRYYKEGVSHFFFICFAFFFGYQIDCLLDLEMHYNDFISFYPGNNLSQILTNPNIYLIGTEPYHIIFKYVVSQISTNSHFFAGCAAAIYAIMFLFFFKQYQPFYKRKLVTIQFLALCGMIFTVEFYWYFGLRYWTGAFFFLGFYSKYILSGKKKYLYFSFLACLFHFAHFLLIAVYIFDLILQKFKKTKICLLIISFCLRFSSINIYILLNKLPFIKKLIKPQYLEESLQESLSDKTDYFREHGNFVYQNRSNVLFITIILLFFLLWKKNKRIFKNEYSKLISFIISYLIIVNIGYQDLIFYDRNFKFVIVLSFSYLFLVLSNKNNLWLNKKPLVIIFFLVIILFSFATAIVEGRDYLFNPPMWLSFLLI